MHITIGPDGDGFIVHSGFNKGDTLWCRMGRNFMIARAFCEPTDMRGEKWFNTHEVPPDCVFSVFEQVFTQRGPAIGNSVDDMREWAASIGYDVEELIAGQAYCVRADPLLLKLRFG